MLLAPPHVRHYSRRNMEVVVVVVVGGGGGGGGVVVVVVIGCGGGGGNSLDVCVNTLCILYARCVLQCTYSVL